MLGNNITIICNSKVEDIRSLIVIYTDCVHFYEEALDNDIYKFRTKSYLHFPIGYRQMHYLKRDLKLLGVWK